MWKRHSAVVSNALRIASRFIIEEEKQLVLTVKVRGTAFSKAREENWSANAAAVLVARKLRPRNSTAIIEEAVGCRCGRAIELAERAVPIIRAALGDQFDLTAAAATFRCSRIRSDRAELLNRIDRRIAGCCKGLARGLIISIDSVDGDVALVCTRAGYGTYAICGASADVVTDNTGLQTNQCRRRVAKLNRQLLHAALFNNVSDTGIGCVQCGAGFGSHYNIRRNLAHGQLCVVSFGVSYTHRDTVQFQAFKSSGRKFLSVALPW